MKEIKYKIGDKVRCIKEYDCQFKKNRIYKITDTMIIRTKYFIKLSNRHWFNNNTFNEHFTTIKSCPY